MDDPIFDAEILNDGNISTVDKSFTASELEQIMFDEIRKLLDKALASNIGKPITEQVLKALEAQVVWSMRSSMPELQGQEIKVKATPRPNESSVVDISIELSPAIPSAIQVKFNVPMDVTAGPGFTDANEVTDWLLANMGQRGEELLTYLIGTSTLLNGRARVCGAWQIADAIKAIDPLTPKAEQVWIYIPAWPWSVASQALVNAFPALRQMTVGTFGLGRLTLRFFAKPFELRGVTPDWLIVLDPESRSPVSTWEPIKAPKNRYTREELILVERDPLEERAA